MNEVVTSGAVKGGGFFLNPLGKINLIVTGIVFLFLITQGIFESLDQHSVYPLLDKTVFKVVGADTQLGNAVDVLESQPRVEKPTSFFSKQMPIWLWFWMKFWFEVIASLWFIYFFCWLIYGFWWMMNADSMMRNIIFTVITFLLVSQFVGMVLYNINLAGYCLPEDKMVNFNTQLKNSYPLHGTIKLFSHFITKDLFYRVSDWSESGFGKAVTNIPSGGLNLSNNQTINFVNTTG